MARRARRGARARDAALGLALARADRAALRGAARRGDGRVVLRGGLERHRGPAPRDAARRRRARRRGDHVAVLVRRVGELRDLRRRDAGVRRHRPAHVQPRRRRRRSGDHGADEGDRRRRHLRLPLRARPADRALRTSRARARRGRLRGARRALQGPTARLARSSDDVRVLSEQADDDGRGRRGHDERRGAVRAARVAPEPGTARDELVAPPRPARLQLPPRRRVGRARHRAGREARPDPRGAFRGRCALRRAARRRATSSRRSPTTRTTSARGSSTS